MIVTHQERPRELKWYHAGPMLYGDWGTSRFYVLGLAFFYALYGSFHYVIAVGILVAAVGWAYTVVCKAYPDGGGVYSAARQISPALGVIGALLLFADYAVTAALSAYDGMRYLGAEGTWAVRGGAIGICLLLGFINYIGPKKAGTLALLIAVATLLCTLVLTAFSIPHLAEGWSHINTPAPAWSTRWTVFTSVVLALSGVEAVANMTGIMVLPVSRTAKKSIWPVLAEVVIFNAILAVAMLAIQPASPTDFKAPGATYSATDAQVKAYRDSHHDIDSPNGALAYDAFIAKLEKPHSSALEVDIKDRVLRVMGDQFVGPWFGAVSGAIFGLLLFSAVNTVIGGMTSVCYVMARDRELPSFFTRLNLFGVPWAGLIPALIIPVVLLLIFSDLEQLADLYAIGVVGAIGINLTSCTINRKLTIRSWERAGLGVVAAVMIAIELTLAFQKLHAVIFVGIILTLGMGMRFFTKTVPALRARKALRPSTTPEARILPEPIPAEPARKLIYGTPPQELDMSKRKVMVATRGAPRLMEFAANYANQINGSLYVIYVRQLNVQFPGADTVGPTLDEDSAAQAAFQMAAEACKKAGVQFVPIYVVSPEVALSILDFAATYSVDALLMGVSRKGSLLRALQGDVLTKVADHLPNEIPLLIHA